MITCTGSFVILRALGLKKHFLGGMHICTRRAQRVSRLTGSQLPGPHPHPPAEEDS